MGQQLLACVGEYPDLTLAGAVVEPGAAAVGSAVPGHPELSYQDQVGSCLRPGSVLIDFSGVEHSLANLEACAAAGAALVLGTTGFDAEQQRRIEAGARASAIFQAANMSLGVNLLARLVRQSSRSLGAAADIEIVETHHRHKVDAPSGTALHLGQAAARGLGRELGAGDIYQRVGQVGSRPSGSIGFATVRGGDVVGNHSVHFLLEGESLELTHKASNRALFARGALRAAVWLAGQQPGRLYGMDDLLDA